jgi:O-antigen/teichoic acid export membrane protein
VALPARLDRPARRRVLRTAAAAGQVVGLPVLSVLVSLLAVRNAGIDTWGAFVGAMVLVNLCAQVADFGSRDALVRAFSRGPGAVSVAWRAAAASRVPLLVVGPVVFIAAGNDPAAVVLMCAWLVGQFTARLHDALVAYRRAFAFSLGVEVTAVGLTLAAVVVSGRAVSVPLLLAAFAGSAWLRAAAMAARFPVLRPGAGWTASRAELRRSWPFFGLTFSGALQSRVDLYVVAALLPAPVLGTYQVLTSFVLLVQSLAGALLGPIVPALYRLSRAGVLRGTRRLALMGLGMATAGIAGTAIAMAWLYGLSVPPAALLAAWVAMLPVFAYLPLVHLAFRDGDERIVLAANLVGIGTAGVGAVLLVPSLGLTGAMLAAAVAQVVILGLHLVRTMRRPERAAGPGAAGGRSMEVVDALPDL